MELIGIRFCVWSSIQVSRSFYTSDIGLSRIFVSLVSFNEADPVTALVALLFFIKIDI